MTIIMLWLVSLASNFDTSVLHVCRFPQILIRTHHPTLPKCSKLEKRANIRRENKRKTDGLVP